MSITIVVVLAVISLFSSYFIHVIQAKLQFKRHLGDFLFGGIFILSLFVLPISIFFIGGWNGLIVGMFGVSGIIFGGVGWGMSQWLKKSCAR